MANFTIVGLCGGGIRGVLSAQVLSNLAAKYPQIMTGTSMFAGTSTGTQIINMILAGWSAPKIVTYYQTTAAQFFSGGSSNPELPAYDVEEAFAGAVDVAGGNKPLSSYLPQQVLMTAFNLGANNTGWSPVLIGNTPNIPNSPLVDMGIADATTASSAMPGMFGSWKNMIDGAYLNHDPTLAAVCIAVASGVPLENIYAITLGTGLMPDWIASGTQTWGSGQWAGPAPAGSGANTPPLYINGVASPIQNVSLSGMTANGTPMTTQLLLGSRYVNINPAIAWTPENDVSAIPALIAAANAAPLGAAETLLQNWPAPAAAVHMMRPTEDIELRRK